MIKVHQEIEAYIVGGPAESKTTDPVIVRSHWNDDKMIVIRVEGSEVAVRAKDLVEAAKNATNTARW